MTKRLRVLTISTLYPRPDKPGFGRFVALQTEALAARGDCDIEVINPVAIAPGPLRYVFNTAADRAVPRAELHDRVCVHHPRFPYIPGIGSRWNPRLIAKAILPLARRLHAASPFDVVDAQFFYPDGPAAAQIARELGLPLSIKARGSDIHNWGRLVFARRIMVKAARQAAGLLAVSHALKRDMVALGMPEERIAVHYTGLDQRLYRIDVHGSGHRKKFGFSRDRPLIVSVGNLIVLKGHDLTIAALAAVPSAQLAIAGQGPELRKLRRLADQLGVADRVKFLGQLDPPEIAKLLNAADVFVLPSEHEGLANVWIEALACGTPLVITDVGGAREIVRDDSAGRIVTRDPVAIALAVNALLAAPPSRPAVAAHAARFSWEANAAQLAEHYFRVAGLAPPSRARRS